VDWGLKAKQEVWVVDEEDVTVVPGADSEFRVWKASVVQKVKKQRGKSSAATRWSLKVDGYSDCYDYPRDTIYLTEAEAKERLTQLEHGC
jgi:hypothetical protein